MCVKRFEGKIYFLKPGSAHNVKEAVLRANKNLVIEFFDEKGWDCTANLERIGKSPNFTGRWKGRKGDDIDSGDADCTIYENKEGYLFLGRFIKRDAEYYWCVKLHEVEELVA